MSLLFSQSGPCVTLLERAIAKNFAEFAENECTNQKHPLVKGDNLTSTAR